MANRAQAVSRFGLLGICFLILSLVACQPPEIATGLRLLPLTYAALPGWNEDRVNEAVPALLKSCVALLKKAATEPIGPGGVGGMPTDWQAPCAAAKSLAAKSLAAGSIDEAEARAFFEHWFRPFAALDESGRDGLFTGYYEAEIEAALAPSAEYSYPLYLPPASPVDFSRAEIMGGALKGKGLEFLWLKDPVDDFFLHIQGSGMAHLRDGSVMRVGYAGNNGHPFVGIAKLMIEAGLIDRAVASMQVIRDWLRRHPDRASEWMNKNPRFIFFQEVKGNGPVGAMNVTLSAGRSLAIDPAFMPMGAPIWLDTFWSIDSKEGRQGQPFRRLMLAQDVGSAIKGPVRGDIFWGSGEKALAFAGTMRQKGRWFLLLPVGAAQRQTLDLVDVMSSLQ